MAIDQGQLQTAYVMGLLASGIQNIPAGTSPQVFLNLFCALALHDVMRARTGVLCCQELCGSLQPGRAHGQHGEGEEGVGDVREGPE